MIDLRKIEFPNGSREQSDAMNRFSQRTRVIVAVVRPETTVRIADSLEAVSKP